MKRHQNPRCLKWEAWRSSLRSKDKESHKGCQARGSKVCIIHYRVGQYPFPLLCLNSDGSRLYPSIAEPTASVPPFFTRSFPLENLADKVGSALVLQHRIPRPTDPLLPA